MLKLMLLSYQRTVQAKQNNKTKQNKTTKQHNSSEKLCWCIQIRYARNIYHTISHKKQHRLGSLFGMLVHNLATTTLQLTSTLVLRIALLQKRLHTVIFVWLVPMTHK